MNLAEIFTAFALTCEIVGNHTTGSVTMPASGVCTLSVDPEAPFCFVASEDIHGEMYLVKDGAVRVSANLTKPTTFRYFCPRPQ